MDDDGESESVWFRQRLSGTGYSPSSWQGWLAVGIFVILVFGTGRLATLLISSYHLSPAWHLAAIALIGAYTVVLLRIVYTHRGRA